MVRDDLFALPSHPSQVAAAQLTTRQRLHDQHPRRVGEYLRDPGQSGCVVAIQRAADLLGDLQIKTQQITRIHALSLTALRSFRLKLKPMATAGQWDEIFGQGDQQRSWYEKRPERSLRAIRRIATSAAAIIDIGGGSSHLAAELLHAGFVDITVLDLSTTALGLARDRLGHDADRVQWIAEDVLAWTPARRYAVWHDRALLHFFTDPRDRTAYARKLRQALTPDGHAIIATFAPDGPDHCSGQPVHRYSTDNILELLGHGFALVDSHHATHRTPSGTPQAFTHVIARRLR